MSKMLSPGLFAENLTKGDFSFYEGCDKLPNGILMHPGTKSRDVLDLKEKLVPRPNDIFVTSYVRSGTNWISYIIQLIVNGGVPLDKDLDSITPCIDPMVLAEVEGMESPRYMKHHYPYDYIAGGPPHESPAKYIYSYRNPRDVAVSLFLVQKDLERVHPPVWSEFLDEFISGNVIYGCQLDHIKGWWSHRDSPNILILSYENMKKDPVGAVQSISTFLGYQLSQKLIEDIALNARIDKMKKNLESFNSDLTKYKFVRKGVVGDWRSYFSTEDIEKLNAAVKEKLGDTDIVFDYGEYSLLDNNNYYYNGGRGCSKMSRTLSPGLFAEKVMKGEFSYYKDCERLPDGTMTRSGVKVCHILELKEKLVPRPSDIFVTSYVRSGTNWISYIIQLIANGGVPPDRDLDSITPCIDPLTLAEVEGMESPRYMKHHYPYDYIAGGPPHESPAKYIYSYRNPRDVAVSQFLLQKDLERVHPPVWSEFLDEFIGGNVAYGCQLDHIKGWWSHRDSPNILILSYENMKKDTVGAVQSISTFLGYQLSQKLIEDIALNARIDKMKKNLESFNSDLTKYKFVRKGVVGDWHSYFSTEDIEKLDAAVKEKLGDTDIVFDYGDI